MSLPRKTLCINISRVNQLQKTRFTDYSKLLNIIDMSYKDFKSILWEVKT